MVVSNIFYVHPYLGKWCNLTNIFQMGWNHQLVSWGKDPSWRAYFFKRVETNHQLDSMAPCHWAPKASMGRTVCIQTFGSVFCSRCRWIYQSPGSFRLEQSIFLDRQAKSQHLNITNMPDFRLQPVVKYCSKARKHDNNKNLPEKNKRNSCSLFRHFFRWTLSLNVIFELVGLPLDSLVRKIQVGEIF